MILITDLCYKKGSLSYYEYVNPVCEIIEDSGFEYDVIHYSELSGEIPEKYSSVIFCGTALKDNLFIEDLSLMQAVRRYNKPVIGICAGMQVVASAYGGDVRDFKKIGMSRIRFSPGDPIFSDIPDFITRSGAVAEDNSDMTGNSGSPVYEFEGYEVHSRIPDMPEDFIPLAESEVFQGACGPFGSAISPVSSGSERYPELIRHRDKPVYGILFHPEVRNVWLIRNFARLSEGGEF
ncbi:glutamine amidotransferase-related protein [Methanoplanus endosymbiosus]|uniref:Gamma-glutamyl-gamma-aminobutyrate hydrolase family protein n=1 Tax=Methanoplanus endosymbiosus TaxID=33865 RepID=A0A9E7TK77_9EURY|nr:gamma-glutamyl-gamma-aminobutyrate hydrolase family protein [Methanoplanus endosymbiosus]UUX92385.1 gamma-glutamyl-gamma-aminobutyrate hydrolase family protein [Methanoplanus endosymbiosus]